MKVASGKVRIGGQQQSMAAAIDVGDIDAAVRANESVARFSNENAILAPDDRAALAQGEFDDRGMEFVLLCPGDRGSRRLDRSQIHHAALGFRDNLVFNDANVAGLERKVMCPERLQKLFSDRIPWFDIVGERDREEPYFGVQ